MRLNQFLDQFEKEHHINLKRTPYDAVSILINQELVVFFKEIDTVSFIMYASLCPLPVNHRERFLEEVLKANLYGTQTGGSSFGIDEKTHSIVQFFRFDQEPENYQVVIEKLKKFVGVAQYYKKIFESI